ncbi:Aspartate/glutamate/uridylate kinase [Haematococcus lacustris]
MSATLHPLCICKLGGAAITVKDSPKPQLRPDVLALCAQHCVQCPGPCIVVHGAGSFGHGQAKHGGVAFGTVLDKASPTLPHSLAMGVANTRAAVTALNVHVVDALVREGSAAVGLPPFASGWTAHGKKLDADGCHMVSQCLEAGLVPVLHGDVVWDDLQGCCVLSGDTVVRRLAEVFRPDHVTFLTNVAGVYDRPPEEPGSRLLRLIGCLPDGTWRAADATDAPMMAGSVHDTTGGMAGKVAEAVQVAVCGVPVLIAEAGSPSAAMALSLNMHQVVEAIGTLDREGTPKWRGTVVMRMDTAHWQRLHHSA